MRIVVFEFGVDGGVRGVSRRRAFPRTLLRFSCLAVGVIGGEVFGDLLTRRVLFPESRARGLA
jgi:hypothetical protein